MTKIITLTLGILFLILGTIGFIPENPLLGNGAFFHADTAHAVTLLATGLILGIVAFLPPSVASTALFIFGGIYMVLSLTGFALAGDTRELLSVLEANSASSWLHLALAIILLGGGILSVGVGEEKQRTLDETDPSSAFGESIGLGSTDTATEEDLGK